jgi:GTP-binding protein EngB required for normal cell division
MMTTTHRGSGPHMIFLHLLLVLVNCRRTGAFLDEENLQQCKQPCPAPNSFAEDFLRRSGSGFSDNTWVELKRKFGRPWPVRIAVTGMVGAGKSTYINTMRKLKPAHECAAPVGSTEQHIGQEQVEVYNSLTNPCVSLADLPGYGTAAFPTKSYAEKFKLSEYDAVVILTEGKLKRDDSTIYKFLRQQGTPVFYAFSRAKDQCESNFEDFGTSCSQTKQQLRAEATRKGFKGDEVFFISARWSHVNGATTKTWRGATRKQDPWSENEFGQLGKSIVKSLNELKRRQMVKTFKDMLQQRENRLQAQRKKAEELLWSRSLIAAANNAFNPVFGAGAVGTAIAATSTQESIKAIFKLDDEALKVAGQLEDPVAVGLATSLSTILLTAAASGTCTGVCSEAAKYAPGIGQAFAGSMAYSSIQQMGKDAIQTCEEVAAALSDVPSLQDALRQYKDMRI